MKNLLFPILILISINSIFAQVGYDNPNLYGIRPSPLELELGGNYTINVNSSDYSNCWSTSEGIKCDVADITYDEISGGDVNDLGYYGYFNGLGGVVGGLAMDGDPWWLGGVDLEIEQDLYVDGNSYLNNTYPQDTLSSDLGSGANRWRWLYVQNISAEEIETYNINILYNLTAGSVTGGELQLVGDRIIQEDGGSYQYIEFDDNSFGYTTFFNEMGKLFRFTSDNTNYINLIPELGFININYQGGGNISVSGNNLVLDAPTTIYTNKFFTSDNGFWNEEAKDHGLEFGDGGTKLETNGLGYYWIDDASTGETIEDNAMTGIYRKKAFGNDILVMDSSNANFTNLNITTEGNVFIGNNLSINGNFTGNQIYGGIWEHDDSGVIVSFPSSMVFYNFTGGNCGLINGFSCNGTSGTLTSLVEGIYAVKYVASGTGQNNHLYHMVVSINGVKQNNTESHGLYTSGTTLGISGIGHIAVLKGQQINLQIEDATGTGNGAFYNWNINLERIGNL